jgi:hypothetical protein
MIATADHNLLYGVLALQMDYIGPDVLIAAVGDWVRDKTRPLDAILADRGALDARQHALLEAMARPAQRSTAANPPGAWPRSAGSQPSACPWSGSPTPSWASSWRGPAPIDPVPRIRTGPLPDPARTRRRRDAGRRPWPADHRSGRDPDGTQPADDRTRPGRHASGGDSRAGRSRPTTHAGRTTAMGATRTGRSRPRPGPDPGRRASGGDRAGRDPGRDAAGRRPGRDQADTQTGGDRPLRDDGRDPGGDPSTRRRIRPGFGRRRPPRARTGPGPAGQDLPLVAIGGRGRPHQFLPCGGCRPHSRFRALHQARRGGPRRDLRGPRRGTGPRGGPQGDQETATPTTRRAALRFQFEAEVTGGLEHPGIVPVYGLGHYADGRPLLRHAVHPGHQPPGGDQRYHAARGRDPGRDALERHGLLRRFVDVCNAMDYAHSRR